METPETIAVFARLGQYVGAAICLGTPIFVLRNADFLHRDLRVQRLVTAGAMFLIAGTMGGILAQTAIMFGEAAAALRPGDVLSILAETQIGHGYAARLVLAILFLGLAVTGLDQRSRWVMAAVAGAAISATFAWTGHGAATEGTGRFLHLSADILHALAASVWLGALPILLVLIVSARRTSAASDIDSAHSALDRFSGVGTLAVATLVVTGLINSWFLVGPDRVTALVSEVYGQLLLAKLGLFASMFLLAAANRFRLTPALRDPAKATDRSLSALQKSIAVETSAGVLVLAAVAWLGMLAPPVSS